MKIYLVKKGILEVNENGKAITRYNGIEDDYHFSSSKKAYSWINYFIENQEEWTHNLFPYNTWTKKKEFYEHNGTKYYSKIELHQIEVE